MLTERYVMGGNKIKDICAYQVLNSRAEPTVRVDVVTGEGIFWGIAPSGASKGKYEVREKYDCGKKFGGKSVGKIAGLFNKFARKKLVGMDCTDQAEIDNLLRELMEYNNASAIGSNFAIATSIACCKAGAHAHGLTLYNYIQELYEGKKGRKKKSSVCRPMFNVINSGAHVGVKDDLQEHLIIPWKFRNMEEAIFMGAEIYLELKKRIKSKYGAQYSLVGDEGGFFIPERNVISRMEFMIECAESLGYGKNIKIGIDAAASQFYDGERYLLFGKKLTSEELVGIYEDLVSQYPFVYLEDGMAEDDLNGWELLGSALSEKVMLVGDDITVTNPILIEKHHSVIDGVIIKPNQIGTITDTIEAVRTARKLDLRIAVSHRSGENEDTFIADFAMGVAADFCKFGAPARGERTCKYNRLIEILRTH